MKIGKVWLLVFIAGIGGLLALVSRNYKPIIASQTVETTPTEKTDLTAIGEFTGKPGVEVTYVSTDLPTPYFRVGKVSQVEGGENMEAVESWVRKVNVYDQKELIDGKCSVYEYQSDVRNHKLVAVVIKGIKQGIKPGETGCVAESGDIPKIDKTAAEIKAWEYLARAVPNFDQIKDQFVYSTQRDGEAHEWLWEDKNYRLPEGLSSRPYSGPIIRMVIYGNKEIQYWNTTSLFE